MTDEPTDRDVDLEYLRDSFASAALTGLLARHGFAADSTSRMDERTQANVARIAGECYLLADAMLAERVKRAINEKTRQDYQRRNS